MVRILPASCSGGVVTVEGKEIECEILSQGTKSSTGIVILDGLSAKYIVLTTLDLNETISKMVQIVSKISEIALGIDGVTNAPGGQTANFTLLNTLKTELNAIKDNLR